MTEELRGLLRDELDAERPPPLGDLVGAALRDGRRIRRQRRLAAVGGGTAVLGTVALAVALGHPLDPAAAPLPGGGGQVAGQRPGGHSEVTAPSPGTVLAEGRGGDGRIVGSLPAGNGQAGASAGLGISVTVPPAATRAAAVKAFDQAAATPEAMLFLLEKLVPPGRTSEYAKTGQRDLHVQLYLDRGKGPGMIRISVSGYPSAAVPRTGRPAVTVDGVPDNCIQSRIVRAEWPDGLVVRADLATCLAWDGKQNPKSPLALTDDEATAVVADPRWGLTMDADLVKAGADEFRKIAYFG